MAHYRMRMAYVRVLIPMPEKKPPSPTRRPVGPRARRAGRAPSAQKAQCWPEHQLRLHRGPTCHLPLSPDFQLLLSAAALSTLTPGAARPLLLPQPQLPSRRAVGAQQQHAPLLPLLPPHVKAGRDSLELEGGLAPRLMARW